MVLALGGDQGTKLRMRLTRNGIIPFSVKNSLNGKGDFGARLGGGGQLAGSVAAKKRKFMPRNGVSPALPIGRKPTCFPSPNEGRSAFCV